MANECDAFAAEFHLDKVQFIQKPQDMLISDGKSLRDLTGGKAYKQMRNVWGQQNFNTEAGYTFEL